MCYSMGHRHDRLDALVEYARIAPMMAWLWSPIAAATSLWRGRANAQIAVAIGGASIVPGQPRVVVQIAWSTERMKQVDRTAWRPPATPGGRPVG